MKVCTTTRGQQTHPELVVMSRWALLDEGTIVGGDVPVVGVFLQHVDLQLNLLLLVLEGHKVMHTNTAFKWRKWAKKGFMNTF